MTNNKDVIKIKRVIAFSCYICMLCFLISLQSCSSNQDIEEDLLQFPPLVTLMDDNNVVPIIAHRGCWSGDSFPQNSLAAFRKALQLNILGTEFDVRQTLDNLLVINHGATFDGLEISKTRYADLCRKKLGNGENLPLLEDFLRAYVSVETNVQMIVELKSCNVERVIEMLKRYDVLSHVFFVSFSKDYCNYLVKSGFGQVTYFLRGNMTPQAVFGAGYGGIDYSHTIFEEHPEWIEEAKALGLKVGIWTINNTELIKSYLADSVIVTTDKAEKWESFINKGQH